MNTERVAVLRRLIRAIAQAQFYLLPATIPADIALCERCGIRIERCQCNI
jgi:hypothetical protein